MPNNNTGMGSQQHHTINVEDVQQQPENLFSKRIEAEEMMKENLSAFYSKGVPLVNIWMALSFVAKMTYHQVSLTSSPWTIMYLGCLVLSFLTDIAMSTMFVTRQFWGRWMLAYLSTIVRIAAATALMLFFDTPDTVIVLPLFVFVIVLLIYSINQMFGPGVVPGRRWLHFKANLNRGFEMSAAVVAPSVAGLSGKVLGYAEAEVEGSLTAGGRTAAVITPECFLFCSAVSGLLLLLFCTVPPALLYMTDMRRMAEVYIPSIGYMALLLLVVANVMAAEKILHEYVYLVCCPILILASSLYLRDDQRKKDPPAQRTVIDERQEEDPPAQRTVSDERQDEAKMSKYLFTAGISPILTTIMAIHSSYGGSTVSLGWSWKAFLSLALCSILSATLRIFISDRMTQGQMYEISRNFWTKCTIASMICTHVLAGLVTYLHPDEVKNIF